MAWCDAKQQHCPESGCNCIEPNIHVERTPIGFIAVDLDRYDGAPDGDTTHGTGSTPEQAIDDLLEQYAERSR